MEPRGCLAQYDRDEDRYTIRCTVQSVHQIRAALAGQIFQVPHSQVRVMCDTMGGGFGHEGRLLSGIRRCRCGRRKWSAGRCAGSPSAARGCKATSRRGAASSRRSWRSGADGKFLALRTSWVSAIGAYYSTDRPTIPLTIGMGCLVNTYTFAAVHAEVTAVLTNTMTTAPYRGGSRPEPIYVTESIIEQGGARTRDRPGGTAPPQHDPGERDAVPDADAADL